MADTSVVDLDANFVGFGWCDLDVLDGQFLAGFPCNGSLHVCKLLLRFCSVPVHTLQVMVYSIVVSNPHAPCAEQVSHLSNCISRHCEGLLGDEKMIV